MPSTEFAAVAVAALAEPIKYIFEQGKERFKDRVSKLNNSRKISALATKVAAYEQVKTIWRREKKVRLSSFYYPSRVVFDEGVVKEVKSLKGLPRQESLVIQGTVGQGKSVFLRYLCVQELTAGTSGRVPIFVELRKLEVGFDLKQAIFSTLVSLGVDVDEELFSFYAETGRFVILLDGFDEISEGLVGSVVTTLESWCVQFPNLQFIVTSRPGSEIQKSNFFRVLPLAPLAPEDQKEFLKKIGVKADSLSQLMSAIEESHVEIKGLLTTPLLLTLLVLVYQSEGVVPNELPDFFKMLFSTVFVRHDRTKPAFKRIHKSGLNERALEQFFEAFCFAVMRRGMKVNLKREQFEVAFNDARRFCDIKCDFDGFKYDVVNVACLLQEDGPYTSFVHKSLLDFFPASFIKGCSDAQSEKIYAAILLSWRNWVPVLKFLEYIDKYRFAKNFAIPSLESVLKRFGADGDVVGDTCVQMMTSYLLPASACFRFSLDDDGKSFKQHEFGPYHDLDCYLHSGFVRSDLLFKKKNLVPFDFLSCRKINERGFEEYFVEWRDAIGSDGVREVELDVRRIIDELRAQLSGYREFVSREAERAELLASFELSPEE